MVGAVHRRTSRRSLVAGATLFALRSASAQPVVDQALSDAQVAVEKGCTILKVTFNIRIRYASHFPLDRGDELRITVNPIDRNQAAALLTLRREAATVPDGKRNGIKAIDLETQNPTGPVLRILSIVRLPIRSPRTPMPRALWSQLPEQSHRRSASRYFLQDAGFATAPFHDGAASIAIPKTGRSARFPTQDLRAVAGWMDEARAALHKNNLGGCDPALDENSQISGKSVQRRSAGAVGCRATEERPALPKRGRNTKIISAAIRPASKASA